MKFVDRGVACVEFAVDLYLLASLMVRLRWDRYSEEWEEAKCAFARPLKQNAERVKVPIVLLDAIAKGDLRKLAELKVVERDYHYITLDIPGHGEVRIRGSLISDWRSFFKGKDVGKASVPVPPYARDTILCDPV